MINIVCLKWGKKYGPEYVNRLYAGVARNITVPFAFHCFTDNPKDIRPEVIIHSLPLLNLEGWWNKLYLFSKELPIDGRIMFLDLDTLIVGNIDDIVSASVGFIGLHDFYSFEKGRMTAMGSGLLSFNSKSHTHIWNNFINHNPQAIARSIHPGGDQVWIERQQPERLYWQDLFPGQVVSYKVHCLAGLPSAARIVCYHGIPSIPDSVNKTTRAQNKLCGPSPWVADHWKD